MNWIGKKKGGLYLLLPDGLDRNKITQQINSCLAKDIVEDSHVRHSRLEHMPARVVKQIASLKDKISTNCNFNNCTICPLARQLGDPT